MGRSGTSLATHWVQGLNLDVGDGFLEVKVGNINGSFEDADFRQWHTDLLALNGMKGWLDVPAGPVRVDDALAERGQALVAERNSRCDQWAFKDPMASLVLDYWVATVANPRVLFVYREPELVVQSILRLQRNNQKIRKNKLAGAVNQVRWNTGALPNRRMLEQCIDAWITYNGLAARTLEGLDPAHRRVVTSTQLVENSGQIHRWVAEHFDDIASDPMDEIFDAKEMHKSSSLDLGSYRLDDRQRIWGQLEELGYASAM